MDNFIIPLGNLSHSVSKIPSPSQKKKIICSVNCEIFAALEMCPDKQLKMVRSLPLPSGFYFCDERGVFLIFV
jgi:hypothetical protein